MREPANRISLICLLYLYSAFKRRGVRIKKAKELRWNSKKYENKMRKEL